ncbi:MAG: nucleotide exchange factor GrpE [Breznakia sp.]
MSKKKEMELEDVEKEEIPKTDAEEVKTASQADDKEKKRFKKKNKKEDALKEEILTLKEELGNMKNEYYKAFADTENVRKRLLADAEMQRKYRIQSFAQEILPAIDNLERAIAFEAKDDDVKHYVDGIQMIYQQLKTSLEHEGVTTIEALEKPFDPKVHQALIGEKVEDVEPGVVVEEIQKGYMLKDRVLRASLVKVSE